MFCTKCGNNLPDNAAFCTKCGKSLKESNNQTDNRQNIQRPETSNQQFRAENHTYGQINQQYPQENYPSQQFPAEQGYPPFTPGGEHQMFFPQEPEKKGNKGIVIALVILTVIILALCGVLLYFVLRGDSSSGHPDSSSSESYDSNDSSDISIKTTDSQGGEKPITGTASALATQPKTQATTARPSGYSGIQELAVSKKTVNFNYVSSDVSEYPLVKVYFTAEDDIGQSVLLNSPTAGIKETVSGGKEVEREVKSIEQLKGREGVNFALVADKSGSMEYDLPVMQSVMSQFVDALDYKSGDKAELIAFDTYVMYMCTYTNDPQLLKNGINNMSAGGRTALYDALLESVLNAGSQQGARCVIAFTDGDDLESVHTAEEVIQQANQLSVPVFIIGTNDASYSDYDRIAESTGGQYWNINNISDMNQILDQIYDKEKDMYCIEYVSDSKEEPKKERKINIAVADDTYGGISEMQFTPTEARKQQAHTSRYEVIKADMNWAEANAECIRRGGHLITITSDDEMNQAVTLAESAGIKYVWIGGYTSVRGNTAYGHWITGEAFNYQKWYPGEPSRNDNDGTPEMYLMLWNVDSKGWTWNDQRDNLFTKELAHIFAGKTGYICEYES